jgi:hypothetical protein
MESQEEPLTMERMIEIFRSMMEAKAKKDAVEFSPSMCCLTEGRLQST